MKRYIILASGVIVVIVIAFVAYAIFNSTSTPTDTGKNIENPFGKPAGIVPIDTTNSNGTDGLSLKLQDGTNAFVPDFTKTNQPLNANAISGYQIAGSDTADFQILYYPQNSGILVSLFSEPLGANRLAAENALRADLRLSNAQLCKLIIDVRTTSEVNTTYSGRNLGLSFCPGATPLPQ